MAESQDIGETLPDGRKLYKLESRKSIELPLSEVATKGTIEVFPHVEEKGLLFLQFRRRKLIISAGPYIGLIPLTPNISIEVRPKLPVSNLSRVLDSARQSLSILRATERLYLTDNLASVSVLEFLATNLYQALRPVVEGGFLKSYNRASDLSSQPRGRIEIAPTLRAWGRGQHHKVQSSRFDQSSNIAPNRVLKAALQLVLQRLQPTNDIQRSLIKEANLTYAGFPSSIGPMIEKDRSISARMVSTREFPDQKTYYYRAIEIALMVLSETGISLQDAGSDVSLASFIVNFEDLFEEYLRRVLQNGAPNGCSVRDGNKEGRRYLFDERKGAFAQPDIVIKGSSPQPVIAEVKYKEKPNRDDINQAITYANCYRTNRAVLVHQSTQNGVSGLYVIGNIAGITLNGYAFDLSATNIDEQEANFSHALFRFAKKDVSEEIAA